MQAVGIYLRELRAAGGLTQEQAGQRGGISTKSVERWEAGKTEPALTDLVAYVKALHGDVQRVVTLLLGDDNEPDPLQAVLDEAKATGATPLDPEAFSQFLDLVANGTDPKLAARIALRRP
jgi:transcriptional regulator with XRE-family HTH domain